MRDVLFSDRLVHPSMIRKALLPMAVWLTLPFVSAEAQVKPALPVRIITADSLNALDVDSIEIIKGARAGSYIGTTRNRQQLMDTLELNRRRWEQTRPHGYAIRVLAIDHCIIVTVHPGVDRFVRKRLVVHDTVITAREDAPIPEVYSQRCGYEWRVEDLFRDLAGGITDTTAMVSGSIQYDPAYGFPRRYWIARGSGRSGGVLVESFAPVR
jgi:hypothetical protein